MEKLIITAAIQGAEISKDYFPNLPVTPAEVAREAYEAYIAGAAIIHLHVRDEQGRPTQDIEVFRKNIEAIKSTGCKAIIQVSTGGAVGMSAAERMQHLTLMPEYASLNTGSINFGDQVFMNPPKLIEELAKAMQKYGVRPEFEIYEEGHIHNSMALVRQGLVLGHLDFQFVLGVPGGMSATPKNLMLLVDSLPNNATWSVAGIGRYQLPLATMAMLMGGNVRVGFEDNIYYSKGELAKSNSELVARIVRIARELDRPVATVDEARQILHIPARP
jgi:3-keto-5-aminohexanoate cleavage enzyme